MVLGNILCFVKFNLKSTQIIYWQKAYKLGTREHSSILFETCVPVYGCKICEYVVFVFFGLLICI